MKKPINITKDIYYVGVAHKDLRLFDVIMKTEHGTTYNSYLITGKKNVIVEAVREGFEEEYLANISAVIDPKNIDYIIINHTEPDHTGGLKKLLKAAPNATIYASKGGCKFLKNMLNEDFKYKEVGDGDVLDLGDKKIKFISTPFLHWPDTMFSYIEEENVLFPCDAYGCHFYDERLFDDKVSNFDYDFSFYFDHVMRPFKDKILQAGEKVANLKIDIICPSHGPILRTNPKKYIEKYRFLSQIEKSGKNAIIAYVSAYGNTKKMAEKIKEGLEQKGVSVHLHEALNLDMGSLLGEFERADALILGSPTINGDALKPIHDILSSLATVKIRGKLGAAFGSYGWSGEGVDILYERMKKIKFTAYEPGIKVNFVPTENDLLNCVNFGAAIGEKIVSGQ